MHQWRIWLATAATVAVVGFAIWGALSFEPDKPKPVGMKNLSGTVAEGFYYRSGKEKFPRATCDACRIGKMKMGLISLGAFNTLEFDNLVVNVPTNHEHKIEKDTRTTSEEIAPEVVDSFSLKPLIGMAQNGLKKSFSSIRINGFQLNRMLGEELELVFSVGTLRNNGRNVVLRDVVLNRNGEKKCLKSAELKLKPRIVIVWSSGEWDITDIINGGSL